ncbi:site-specific DNA-methyltransferase [uncultured Treponema sp.]|uniref:site-specific DNA-methyltransferase n=1 Tax=uncultured Treponema sp. TaxID=162155 RepID=UPI0025E19392|nr:site-specific DNA-methyltransferase [uncultured Treponema sp.]
MKTDIQTANEAVTPNSRELTLLKKYFPQCFSKPDTDENGNIIKEHFDVEKLTELLNKDEVDIKKEGFTLNFLGKSYAHYQSNLDSETVIVPDDKNSETDSENVYIVGDNLDALQHLKYSYAEKIKCIYIDPPYNTGKDDFVYNDKFGFTAKELVEKLDVSEEEAERICSMNGKCTHSAWLTFMYPRLALARELLRDDGVIFISIDDNEQANLKRLCDEVFGEGNALGPIIQNKQNAKNDTLNIQKNHEYILVYRKNIFTNNQKELPVLLRTETKIRDIFEEDGRFYYLNDSITTRGEGGTLNARSNLGYTIYYNPKTKDKIAKKDYDDKLAKTSNDESLIYQDDTELISRGYVIIRPPRVRSKLGCWTWDLNKFQNEIDSIIITGKQGSYAVHKRTFVNKELVTEENGKLKYITEEKSNSRSIIDYSTNDGTTTFTDVMGEDKKGCFNNPKNVEMLQYFFALCTHHDDIVLDFFSGSASSAHAIMKMNADDNSNRKFIMVQLDEPVKKDSEAEKAGYKTIDEIGRERIRRAAAKIKAEHPDTTADLGFKTYYLKSMPKETLDKIKVFDPNELFTNDGNIVKSLGEKTLLQTWQIKDGFGFNAVPQKIDLSGYTAYLLDDEKIGKYLYLLGEIEEKSIKELIRKIESLELTVDKIFIYGYSFDFNMLTSITTNLKTLKNRNPLEPIVRY